MLISASACSTQVNELLEESTKLHAEGNLSGALERAKDAGKKERALCKMREQSGLGEQINPDLTYSVCSLRIE